MDQQTSAVATGPQPGDGDDVPGGRVEPSPRRAPAWAPIAVMAVLSLLTAGSFVGWARTAGSEPRVEAPEPVESEVPARLAADVPLGEVPAAVEPLTDLPLVAAQALEDLPAAEQACTEFDLAAAPEVVQRVVVTPDGAAILAVATGEQLQQISRHGVDLPAFEAPPPMPAPMPPPVPGAAPGVAVPAEPLPAVPGAPADERMRLMCPAAADAQGQLMSHMGFSMNPVGMPLQGQSMWCCTGRDIATAFVVRPVADDVRWVLQERDAYAVVYPVVDGHVVLSWRYREGPRMGPVRTTVRMVDAEGAVVDEVAVDA